MKTLVINGKISHVIDFLQSAIKQLKQNGKTKLVDLMEGLKYGQN